MKRCVCSVLSVFLVVVSTVTPLFVDEVSEGVTLFGAKIELLELLRDEEKNSGDPVWVVDVANAMDRMLIIVDAVVRFLHQETNQELLFSRCFSRFTRSTFLSSFLRGPVLAKDEICDSIQYMEHKTVEFCVDPVEEGQSDSDVKSFDYLLSHAVWFFEYQVRGGVRWFMGGDDILDLYRRRGFHMGTLDDNLFQHYGDILYGFRNVICSLAFRKDAVNERKSLCTALHSSYREHIHFSILPLENISRMCPVFLEEGTEEENDCVVYRRDCLGSETIEESVSSCVRRPPGRKNES